METKLKVKSESLPVRCDICHQADLFDPMTGSCARCNTQVHMQATQLKKCPYCAEEIKMEAIKCRYCKSPLVLIDLSTSLEKGSKIRSLALIGMTLGMPIGGIVTAFLTKIYWMDLVAAFGRGGLFFYILTWMFITAIGAGVGGLLGWIIKNNQDIKQFVK